MTIDDSHGAFDPVQELEQARLIYFRFKEQILKLQEGLGEHPEPAKAVKEITVFGAEYLKALNNLTRQEVDLGKQRNAIRGVLQGGALDLDAARAEILGRIARIREHG